MVRHRLGIGAHGRPLYTDLLGELVSVDGEQLTVRTEAGVEHSVARTDVTAAKRVPPRPVRYSEMAALERIADNAWPAPDHERMGDWFLRAAAGFTNRANSVLPVGDPGCPLEDAVDACVDWYAARSLPPRITVPLPLRRDVADVLTRRGWYAQPLVLVQTAALSDILAIPEPAATVRLSRRPSAGFLEIITARKAGLPPAAHHILGGPPEVRFAEAETDGGTGTPLPDAIARGAVVGDWLHLGLVEVAEMARRRGLARAVTRALAGWASEAQARRAVLQVEQRNTAAVALYASMGFHTHHTYVTFRGR